MSRVKRPLPALAAAGVLATAVIAGCGSTLKATPTAAVAAQSPAAPGSCPATVLATLSSVLQRVYREGVHGERIGSAEYLITHSQALRTAVESDNRPAARAAAHALLATGHMTNLTITRGGQTLVNIGGPALAPLQGTLTSANGTPIANYRTSVWADNGFLIEAGGITQGVVVLRAGRSSMGWRSLGGSRSLGSSALANEGALMLEHVAYQYTSFPGEAYPSGALRVYLLIPASASAALCGPTPQDTAVNTLRHVAELIYTGELGQAAQKQVQRVQHNTALLEAVAHREPAATEAAIKALLNEHIVRLRVSAAGQLLSDVGGPYVLAPVSAQLRLHGRTIGSFVLSIQDDEGYLRLTRRLAGLDVLMYMNPEDELVKDSLGPAPGPTLAAVPASGAYTYEGRSFRVFTVQAKAFPSGPLTIRVLVPIPYS
ncbi:MAG: hypothetical protein ABSG93_15370 [Solirubrobacteraceae bacterium]